MQFLPIDTAQTTSVGPYVAPSTLESSSSEFADMLGAHLTSLEHRQTKLQQSAAQAAPAAVQQVRDKASDARNARDMAKDVYNDVEREAAGNADGPVRRLKKAAEGHVGKDAAPSRRDKDLEMSREDFNAIKDNLKKLGFSEEQIKTLEEEFGKGTKVTWGDFMDKMMAIAEDGQIFRQGVQLSNQEERNLIGFFEKIGFTMDEAKGLADDLQDGKFAPVFAKVTEKLASLPADAEISFNEQEAQSLAKVLGLSEESTKRLTDFLQNSGEKLSPKDVLAGLALLKKDVAEALTAQKSSIGDLRDEISALLAKARDREGLTDPSRNPDSAKVIEASREKTANDKLVGDQQNNSKSAEDNANDKLVGDQQNNSKSAEDNAKDGEQAAMDGEAKGNANGDGKGENGARNDYYADTRFQESAGDSAKDTTKESDGWERFWDKIADRTDGSRSLMDRLTEAARNVKADASKARPDAPREQIMEQVRSGILRDLAGTTVGSGGKQLTLQLAPAHLGQLQVMLSMNANNELNATIRTDNMEVSRVVSEQLAVVREALQQQGLKVEKLDVQTGLSGDDALNAKDWHGADQHNLQQRRDEMSAIRTRMKNLRMVAEAGDAAVEEQVRMASIRRQITAESSTLSVMA